MSGSVSQTDIARAQAESGWTDTRVKVAIALFADGFSDAQVAGTIGNVTRNAVAGMRWRKRALLNNDPALAARPLNKNDNGLRGGNTRLALPRAPRAPRAAPSRAAAAARVRERAPSIDDAAIPAEQRRALIELGPDCCHWPVGDPLQPGFFFCGAAKSGDGEPYCPSHMRRAITQAA